MKWETISNKVAAAKQAESKRAKRMGFFRTGFIRKIRKSDIRLKPQPAWFRISPILQGIFCDGCVYQAGRKWIFEGGFPS
jgi:hypothetical protein